jgi:fatty-acid peroxygenase
MTERGSVVIFDEAVDVLGAAILQWAGVPLTSDAERGRRARQLAAMVDGFATPGRPYIDAVRARIATDRWARGLIRGVRDGSLSARPETALAVIAHHRDGNNQTLPVRVAAVELLNVLRPTVAVAWFMTFAAVALAEHPQWRQRIAQGDPAGCAAFAQEVRRRYPFVPVLAARARYDQDVLGVAVSRNGYVVLDVHGTTHDPAHWPDPDRFEPSRFLTADIDADSLVPQGGGDVATGHRCPGEQVVLDTLGVAIGKLAAVPFTINPQDLNYSLTRMPTRPRSGVVLTLSRTAAASVK